MDVTQDRSQQPDIYILHDETWHQGVVGLVASRIKERTNRPVIALAPGDGENEYKGSARSVDGLHIRDLLARIDALYPNLMHKFGGHAMAAGLSIKQSNLAKFSVALEEVTHQMTKGRDWSQTLLSDGELDANEFTLEFAEQIQHITPWGQTFPEPVFDGQFEVIDARIVGDTHAKLKLRPTNSSEVYDAICFGYLNSNEELPHNQIRAAYKLDVNEFRGQQNLQLMVQYIEQLF